MEISFVDGFALIVGSVVVPLVTALFTRPRMRPESKQITAVVVSVFVAIAFAIGSGMVEGVPAIVTVWFTRIVLFAGIIIPLAQGYYRLLKPAAKQIERNSSDLAND